MAGNWKKFLISGVVVAILMLLPLSIELGTNIMNLLVMLFIYIILAQSWNIISGYTLQIHLGLAAFFGCGVLVTHALWEAGIPIYLAVLVGAMASVILAGIIGLPTLRLRGMYFAIGTLALAETLRITIGNVFPREVWMPATYAATYSLLPRYYLALIVAIIACVVVYLVANSKPGLAMVALGDDEEAAQVTGVNIFRYKVLALAISALLAGLAGGVYAFLRLSLLPKNAFVPIWSFEPLVATAIGGAGTVIGPIVGSIFLVALSEIFALTLGESHLIIFGILFILVVLYFPYGLVGVVDRVRRFLARVIRRKREARGGLY